MIIKKVESKKDAEKFINISVSLYKDDKYWIRPLDKDISNVFQAKSNKAFKKGEVSRWIIEKEKKSSGKDSGILSKK
jgi:hypothetical protein